MTKTLKTPTAGYEMLSPDKVEQASRRMGPYLHVTPMLSSSYLNTWLKNDIIFKMDGFQKTGAFKARGALNALLALKEQNTLPNHVVAFSSGNHAQALAWAGKMLDVQTTLYLPKIVSKIKQQATRSYGAEVVITQTRQEAEDLTEQGRLAGATTVLPFDDDYVIAGQGTACFEVLQTGIKPDAIFAPCGGGGLLSGTWLAGQLLSPKSQVYAAEPLLGNDAARSYREGRIVGYTDSPPTIADGARTLRVAERTFAYLRQLAGFYEITEEHMLYWTQWLIHLLKANVEPTSALAMAAAHRYIAEEKITGQKIVVILSGGNIAPETQRLIWEKNYLETVPTL